MKPVLLQCFIDNSYSIHSVCWYKTYVPGYTHESHRTFPPLWNSRRAINKRLSVDLFQFSYHTNITAACLISYFNSVMPVKYLHDLTNELERLRIKYQHVVYILSPYYSEFWQLSWKGNTLLHAFGREVVLCCVMLWNICIVMVICHWHTTLYSFGFCSPCFSHLLSKYLAIVRMYKSSEFLFYQQHPVAFVYS